MKISLAQRGTNSTHFHHSLFESLEALKPLKFYVRSTKEQVYIKVTGCKSVLCFTGNGIGIGRNVRNAGCCYW